MATDNNTIQPVNPPTLWAGFDNSQVKGDDLNRQILLKRRGLGQQIIKYNSTANYPQPQQTPLDTVLQTTAGAGAGTFDVSAFLSNNKLLVFGAVGVLGYLFFVRGGGSALAEKSVITRYATRK